MKIKRVETFYTIVKSQGFVMSTSQNQSMIWHIRILLINISSKNMAPNHPVHLTYHKITTKDCSNSYTEPSIINVQEKTISQFSCALVFAHSNPVHKAIYSLTAHQIISNLKPNHFIKSFY